MHYAALIGGLLVLAGCFLPWISLGGIIVVRGFDTAEGAAAIVLGLCAAAVASYNISNKSDRLSLAYPVCGIFSLIIGVYHILELRRKIGMMAEGLKAAEKFLDIKTAIIEYLNIMGIGLWIIGLGGLVLIGVGLFNAFPTMRPKFFSPSVPGNKDNYSAPSPQTVPKRQAFLCGMTGTYAGQQIPVPEEGVVIGRDPSQCSLVLHSPSVSRRHARLSQGPTPESWILGDLGSTNGTFLQERSSWIRIAAPVTLTIFRRFRVGDDGNEFEIR